MNWIEPWLTRLERAGNRLPPPAILFLWLIALVAVFSALAQVLGWQLALPGREQPVQARSLISTEGLSWWATHLVDNFVGFAPVGAVLVTMLGLGVAEHSGLLRVALTRFVRALPGSLLSLAVVSAGILSNIAFDVGYVVLIPLAGMLFHAAGREPLAGIAAGFAGVSAGYSANLVLGPVDVILAGLTQEAMQSVEPGYEVSVAGNYYFTLVSTFLLAGVGAWVTERLVAPHLAGQGAAAMPDPEPEDERPGDGRALKAVGFLTLVYAAAALAASWPDNALISGPDGGFPMSALVPMIALYAALAGWLFGRISGRFERSADAVTGMENAMGTLATYLVLMFFAAQFVEAFAWSGLGTLVAATGADWLSGWQGQSVWLLAAFVFISALINLFVGSASAKWGILAPVFVPMLYLLGVAPEQTQMAYRIGDSATNIITPLMPYFGVVVAFAARYRPGVGIGTLVAMMLPYSLTFLLVWSALFVGWLLLGLPLGATGI